MSQCLLSDAIHCTLPICLYSSLSTSYPCLHCSFMQCCFEGSVLKEEVVLQQTHSAPSQAIFTFTTPNIHPSITPVTCLITTFFLEILANSWHPHSTSTPYALETTSIHLSPTPVCISRLSFALPAQLLNICWHYQHLCQIQAWSAIQQLKSFNISHLYLLHCSSLHFHPHSLLPNISLKMPSSKTSNALFNLLIDLPYSISPSFSLSYLPLFLPVNLQSTVYSPLSSTPYAPCIPATCLALSSSTFASTPFLTPPYHFILFTPIPPHSKLLHTIWILYSSSPNVLSHLSWHQTLPHLFTPAIWQTSSILSHRPSLQLNHRSYWLSSAASLAIPVVLAILAVFHLGYTWPTFWSHTLQPFVAGQNLLPMVWSLVHMTTCISLSMHSITIPELPFTRCASHHGPLHHSGLYVNASSQHLRYHPIHISQSTCRLKSTILPHFYYLAATIGALNAWYPSCDLQQYYINWMTTSTSIVKFIWVLTTE